ATWSLRPPSTVTNPATRAGSSDAVSAAVRLRAATIDPRGTPLTAPGSAPARTERRSEEHTSELQSRENLVCRLLLEKKKEQNGLAEKQEQGGRKKQQDELERRSRLDECDDRHALRENTYCTADRTHYRGDLGTHAI